ncbi:SCO family protein [Sphingomonas sp. MAH-20]|uniref:SCO family protein n=1 Tax=Sphingomonas horti TaxID=2682842 RepID=A0A6I4J1Z9_9SPHN|nr:MULTISPECIES: SCO family protein [Sphingomonas]MBA2919456.1 SCO family protein [Sphingomonas sp. CGMCC 1.13658]MVO78336.1 SCO family protein [Sphingomonas horti]
MKAALVGVLLAIAAPSAGAGLQPAQFGALAFRQHPGAQVPLDTVLRDERGRPVRLGALLANKPAVLVLEYLHCPNLCGLVLSGLVRDLKAAGLQPGRDLQFVAISIDPSEGPADAARARAGYLGKDANPAGWHFLTGPEAEVRRVADAVGFRYQFDKTIGQYAHPAGFVVLTPDGRIARYLLGFEHDPATLKTAVAEAARDQVEPPAHPLLLLCFGYDPQAGTIAYTAMQALRIAAVAAVVALALYLLASIRRERVR